MAKDMDLSPIECFILWLLYDIELKQPGQPLLDSDIDEFLTLKNSTEAIANLKRKSLISVPEVRKDYPINATLRITRLGIDFYYGHEAFIRSTLWNLDKGLGKVWSHPPLIAFYENYLSGLKHAVSTDKNDFGLTFGNYQNQGIIGYVGLSQQQNSQGLFDITFQDSPDQLVTLRPENESLERTHFPASSLGFSSPHPTGLQLYRFFHPGNHLIENDHLICTNPHFDSLRIFGYEDETSAQFGLIYLFENPQEGLSPLYLYSNRPDIFFFTPLEDKYDYKGNAQKDQPAEEDQLGRDPLVDSLEEIINDVFHADGEVNFTILINGEWGSGKSTLWNLLWRKLNLNGWKKVEYNAWEHQHLKNPWWILINMISQKASKEDWKGIFHSHFWWSLKMKYRHKYVAFFLILLFISGTFVWFTTKDPDVEFISKLIGMIIPVITLFIGIFTRFFISDIGTEELKNRFPEHPYQKIRDRFNAITANNKLVIFIDDLDRCEPEPTVKLLECIQTLFKGSRILYVIAADQQWIIQCFEEYYKAFDKVFARDSLGEKFVQKCFQLRVNIPRIEDNKFKSFYFKLIQTNSERIT